MRPGHLAEIEHGVGALSEGRVEPVGAADREHEVALAASRKVPRRVAKPSESSALPRSSRQHQQAAVSERLFELGCLFPLAGIGLEARLSLTSTTRRKLETDCRTGLGKAIEIAGRKLLFRPRLQAADCEKADPHDPNPSSAALDRAPAQS